VASAFFKNMGSGFFNFSTKIVLPMIYDTLTI
jgi:hypothetical protein